MQYVIPAKAGIQQVSSVTSIALLDPRIREDDEQLLGRGLEGFLFFLGASDRLKGTTIRHDFLIEGATGRPGQGLPARVIQLRGYSYRKFCLFTIPTNRDTSETRSPLFTGKPYPDC